jgi:eukaryotic-like serine/threonine-protein kinase
MEKTLRSPGIDDDAEVVPELDELVQGQLRATLDRLTGLADTLVKHPGETVVPAERDSEAQRRYEAACLPLPAWSLTEESGEPAGSGEPLPLVGRGGAGGAATRVSSAPSSPARPLPNIVLGRTLGEGGMGVVRLGHQTSLGREVAVKTLRAGLSSPALSMKLLHEAWVTSVVEHPNVVPIHDLTVDAQGAPTLIMKRVGGVAWSDLFRQPDEVRRRFGLPPDEWHLQVLIQVSNAVSFAHSRGILHRDLKPENVMIGEFGEVYLLDWGLAVALEPDPLGRLPLAAEANEMAGTPAYMAPEMLGGQGDKLGPRTDVYLLGAILYEILTGTVPHHGKTIEMLIVSVLLSRPHFPRDLPAEAVDICARAMSKEPDHRYESVEELRFAIQGFLRHRESAALSSEATARLVRLETELHAHEGKSFDRRNLYDQLGECRFGYRAALRGWPGNQAAKDGLLRAVTLMVNHELRVGDAKAAEALLADLVEPPRPLAKRVADAVRASELEASRIAQLERDLNPQVGRRTRAFLVLLFGSIWSIAPVAEAYLVFDPVRLLLASCAMVLFTLIVGAWARETLSKTAYNRRAYAVLLLGVAANSLLALAVNGFGLSREIGRSLLLLLWFLSYASFGISAEYRVYPTVLVTLVAFAVSVARPDLGPIGASLSGLTFGVNMFIVWRPTRIFGPPDVV